MISVNFLELIEPAETPKQSYKSSGPVMPGEVVKFSYDEEGNVFCNVIDAQGRVPWRRQ